MTKQCVFETCDREAVKRGMCEAHYTQWHRGMDLQPIRKRRMLHKDAKGRVCTKCDQYKPWDQFYMQHDRGIRSSRCMECEKEYDRERTASGARRRG